MTRTRLARAYPLNMKMFVGPLIVAALLAGGATGAGLLAASGADASNTVRIVPPKSLVLEGFEYPYKASPHYVKTGSVVVDSAVFTVKDHSTGNTLGAGRTYWNFSQGTFDVTTTVRYRTFTTASYTTRVLAHTGDVIPGGAASAARLYLGTCTVRSISLTPVIGDSSAHPAKTGTFAARCDARWGTGAQSSSTDYATVRGVVHAAWHDSDQRYYFSWQSGSAWDDDAPSTSTVTTATTYSLSAPATHPISHAFPVRKYSAEKSVRSTSKVVMSSIS
jgi:hypothetical protein